MPWDRIQYMELQMIARPKKDPVRISLDARNFGLNIMNRVKNTR